MHLGPTGDFEVGSLGARLLLVIAREEPEDLFANAIKVDTHAPQHLSANPLTLVDKT